MRRLPLLSPCHEGYYLTPLPSRAYSETVTEVPAATETAAPVRRSSIPGGLRSHTPRSTKLTVWFQVEAAAVTAEEKKAAAASPKPNRRLSTRITG